MEEDMVTILDEQGEPCQACLVQKGRVVIAVKEDGLLLLPGAFIVLSESGSKLVAAATERS